MHNLKTAGINITEVEQNLDAELEEWRTDRLELHASKEKAQKFENENTNLRRDNLALQVTHTRRVHSIFYIHILSCYYKAYKRKIS